MPQMSTIAARFVVSSLLLASLSPHTVALPDSDEPPIRAIDIGNGITLHSVDLGKGAPVIFVHGSLSDGGYWADQVGQFAECYRAIAYSRRYNYPNNNSSRAGYSAAVDAEDSRSIHSCPSSRQGCRDRSFVWRAHRLVSGCQTPEP